MGRLVGPWLSDRCESADSFHFLAILKGQASGTVCDGQAVQIPLQASDIALYRMWNCRTVVNLKGVQSGSRACVIC